MSKFYSQAYRVPSRSWVAAATIALALCPADASIDSDGPPAGLNVPQEVYRGTPDEIAVVFSEMAKNYEKIAKPCKWLLDGNVARCGCCGAFMVDGDNPKKPSEPHGPDCPAGAYEKARWLRAQQRRHEALMTDQSGGSRAVVKASRSPHEAPSATPMEREPSPFSFSEKDVGQFLGNMQFLGLKSNQEVESGRRWLAFSESDESWGTKGVLALTKDSVDPTVLQVDRSRYGVRGGIAGLSDYVVDYILRMENQTFVGYGKQAADGIPASIPLATIVTGDQGLVTGPWLDFPQSERHSIDVVDVNNSVGRIHDLLLEDSGGGFLDLTNERVLEAHRYAAKHFESPLLRTVFGGLVTIGDSLESAAHAREIQASSVLEGLLQRGRPKLLVSNRSRHARVFAEEAEQRGRSMESTQSSFQEYVRRRGEAERRRREADSQDVIKNLNEAYGRP